HQTVRNRSTGLCTARARQIAPDESTPTTKGPVGIKCLVGQRSVAARTAVAIRSRWLLALCQEPVDCSLSKRCVRAVRTSRWRRRKPRSSSLLRRSQPVTSSLHLLLLHERHAGTTFSSV